MTIELDEAAVREIVPTIARYADALRASLDTRAA